MKNEFTEDKKVPKFHDIAQMCQLNPAAISSGLLLCFYFCVFIFVFLFLLLFTQKTFRRQVISGGSFHTYFFLFFLYFIFFLSFFFLFFLSFFFFLCFYDLTKLSNLVEMCLLQPSPTQIPASKQPDRKLFLMLGVSWHT